MGKTIKDVINAVDTASKLDISLVDWRPVLAQECQVYVFGENYIAKRFDQINFKFCEKNEAKEILIDNLYSLLRFKYFPKINDEVDEKIQKIVSSFTVNLKTTLKKVSFDIDTDAEKIKMLPDYCLAFRNGVYDFLHNEWLFKYDIIKMPELCNSIYLYDYSYAILWYLDFDFEPLPIDISKVDIKKLVSQFKNITSTDRNFCFELMYNMSHDAIDEFSYDRFTHLCEILGYTLLQSFSQSFVMLIGNGQNGKNSLFDGCITGKIIPRPAANDMDSIENDRFITGSLENKSLNIFLETSAKTYTESKMIKAITGSMYQTIERKGIDKHSGLINCKFIFAGNDQEKIKFTDTTVGFRRRINVFETWYRWDAQKRFMKHGDYYDTTFSDNLSELKDDITNTLAYIYFAMFGLVSATKGFTTNFKFSFNDWQMKYTDIDTDLKEKIEKLTNTDIISYIRRNSVTYSECKHLFYDMNKQKLFESTTIKELGYNSYDDMIKMLSDDEALTYYFAENDAYISVRLLQSMCVDLSSPTTFTQSIKKIYSLSSLPMLNGNKPYVKCTFRGKRLRIIS